MMKPIATICMATSLPIPNSEQASGMSNSDPPATPEAPQAEIAASTLKMNAITGSTVMPSDAAAAIAITVIVTAAPAILMVAPSGMETE